MQGLLPNEHLLDQVNATYQKIDGILVVTNVRMLWKRVGDSLFSLSENRLNVKQARVVEDKKVANRFVMQVLTTNS